MQIRNISLMWSPWQAMMPLVLAGLHLQRLKSFPCSTHTEGISISLCGTFARGSRINHDRQEHVLEIQITSLVVWRSAAGDRLSLCITCRSGKRAEPCHTSKASEV